MNALEELRQIADLQECGKAFAEVGKLRYLADRIEDEYMELPKDADGVPCRLGDRVESSGTCGRIKEMLLYERGWEIYLTTLDDSVATATVHHVEPDTWERIEADADVKPIDYCEEHGFKFEFYGNNLPAKIQGRDLVRRCKRLAGVDDE